MTNTLHLHLHRKRHPYFDLCPTFFKSQRMGSTRHACACWYDGARCGNGPKSQSPESDPAYITANFLLFRMISSFIRIFVWFSFLAYPTNTSISLSILFIFWSEFKENVEKIMSKETQRSRSMVFSLCNRQPTTNSQECSNLLSPKQMEIFQFEVMVIVPFSFDNHTTR